jgi:putative methylase
MSFTRKSFAIELSRLKVFEKPKIMLEQYTTESDIASEILWDAVMKGEIQGKTIADLGAGTGILGLGCMLLSAKKVYFVDIDKDALNLAEENYQKLAEKYDLSGASAEFIASDIRDFNEETDLVIENPPFGIKNAHADKAFLEKAFKIAPLIYSLHKTETKEFVEKISKDNGFRILEIKNYSFPLKNTMSYHIKKIQRIDVSCFKIGKS